MAEPLSRRDDGIPDDGPPPRGHEFPGCRAIRLSDDELDDFEGKIEYWDARNQIAILAEGASSHHEYGAQRFAACVKMIAMRRGSPIDLIGGVWLVVRGEGGERLRLLAADQVAYVHPAENRPTGPEIVHGVNALPDVLLEVDYSTDVRRRKLGIYESWGFPEVWVEVPDADWRYRPKSRRSGLTIHVLEGGRYVEAPSSRAFPGWTAEEIHSALNEWEASFETVDTLRRVADTMAVAEGTGPDDDTVAAAGTQRRVALKGRAEGRAEGVAEGRAEGRCGGACGGSPGQPCWRRSPLAVWRRRKGCATWLAELDRVAEAAPLIRLAWTCRDADDFLSSVPGFD